MNIYLKVGLVALTALSSVAAGVAAYQYLDEKKAGSAPGKTTGATKPVKEAAAARETLKQSSLVLNPEENTHLIYRHYRQLSSQPPVPSELYDVKIRTLEVDVVESEDLILSPAECFKELDFSLSNDERPVINIVHFIDNGVIQADPYIMLEVDGDCYVMWKRDAERFVASGPVFKNISTMGYLEALLATMFD